MCRKIMTFSRPGVLYSKYLITYLVKFMQEAMLVLDASEVEIVNQAAVDRCGKIHVESESRERK